MKSSISPAAAILILLMALVSACSRAKPDTSAEGGEPVAPEARILPGGELRYGFTTEPATLDPLDPANTADGRSILFNVFEGLVKPDTGGNFLPAVAEAWEVTEEGRVYVFTLRPGLRFHDGSDVDAADVEFSLNEAIRAGFTGFNQIESVAVTPGGEIRVTLKAPDPEFLPYLAVGIVPRNNAERKTKPIGAGPFSIESYAAQRSLTLVKNPHYRLEGLPYLDKVTIVFVADSDALLLALRAGSIDGAGVTGSLIPQLDPDVFEAVPGYSNSVQMIALNNARPPLDDPRVRQALNYAIDPQEIIDTAFYSLGEPSGSPLIPGLSKYYDRSLVNPYPADADKAKALLAEAGYGEGAPKGRLSLEITVPSNYTMHVDTAQVAVNQLERAGVKAAIRLVDWGVWLSEAYQGRRYTATIISVDSPAASPRGFLSRYRSDAGGNFFNYRSDAFDRVYDEAQREMRDDRRAELYQEAQRIVSGDAAAIYIQDILGFKVFPKGRFGGALNYPLYVTDFSSIYRLQ
ncbi:MAG: ABC transporter substrate-binding protein [Treponema sp.]|jgi:peptide/nickel transport system substrate-binding protein|nr:ABC transporter substrate-binding protein [Treponema sp.]